MKYVLVALLAGFIGYAGASYDNHRSKQLAAERWDRIYSDCIKQGNLIKECILQAHSQE